jgi:hypothetical protein
VSLVIVSHERKESLLEPRREERKAPKPRPEEKPKRFRLIKLEERIAPSRHKTNGCVPTRTVCDGTTGGGYSIE